MKDEAAGVPVPRSLTQTRWVTRLRSSAAFGSPGAGGALLAQLVGGVADRGDLPRQLGVGLLQLWFGLGQRVEEVVVSLPPSAWCIRFTAVWVVVSRPGGPVNWPARRRSPAALAQAHWVMARWRAGRAAIGHAVP
jgi:hypothetical protein